MSDLARLKSATDRRPAKFQISHFCVANATHTVTNRLAYEKTTGFADEAARKIGR